MDLSFSNLRRLRYTTPGPAENRPPHTAQVPTILDAFIPGYAFFCKLVRDDFGFDVSNIVLAIFALTACATGLRFVTNGIFLALFRYFTAAVTVDADDVVYDRILDWAARHPTLGNVRSLHVHSVALKKERGEVECERVSAYEGLHDPKSNSNGDITLRYDLYKGAHWFWHRKHLYRLAREDQQGPGVTVQNRERLTLTVLGRSTQPIKDLIIEAVNGGIEQKVVDNEKLSSK